MRNNIYKSLLSFVIGWVLLSTVAFASPDATFSVVPEIRRELVTLPYYSMFDNLSFQLDGSKVTLSGEVWWPALKKSAERAVSRVEGITSVENQIEVLPTSLRDDSLRLATARALFSDSLLRKYVRPGVSFGLLPHRSDIHIIVKNGNVTLEGVVLRKTDSDVAYLVARGVSGVFSVTNNLRVEDREES
ncbi:MAG: BON domain-containing protein [Acidobacteriota bacterium]|jgi:hyperosmotically inducible protein